MDIAHARRLDQGPERIWRLLAAWCISFQASACRDRPIGGSGDLEIDGFRRRIWDCVADCLVKDAWLAKQPSLGFVHSKMLAEPCVPDFGFDFVPRPTVFMRNRTVRGKQARSRTGPGRRGRRSHGAAPDPDSHVL